MHCFLWQKWHPPQTAFTPILHSDLPHTRMCDCKDTGLVGDEEDLPELSTYRGGQQALSCLPRWMDTGAWWLCPVNEEKHYAPAVHEDFELRCMCTHCWDLVHYASSGNQFIPIASTVHKARFPHLTLDGGCTQHIPYRNNSLTSTQYCRKHALH